MSPYRHILAQMSHRKVRDAALHGRGDSESLGGYLPDAACAVLVRSYCMNVDNVGTLDFHRGSDVERRMFLLFAAKAIKDEASEFIPPRVVEQLCALVDELQMLVALTPGRR